MQLEKKVISDLTLCYCVVPLTWHGEQHFLVASEKEHECLLFDRHGALVDTVWEGPGGTMSAVQVPGSDGAFLATHRFYSPNNSKEASIVLVRPENGEWKVSTLVELPYVHRFDILRRNGVSYLQCCCLKSGYEYKDDWRFPGMTLACRLPDDLATAAEVPQLQMTELKGDMLKNHGYSRNIKNGMETGIVTCESGVYRFTPPETPDGAWSIDQLIGDPVSDAVLGDFDGCGREELLTLSPFHGDTLSIYKESDGGYAKVFVYEEKIPFAHAICTAKIGGKTYGIVGHRKEARDLLAVAYNGKTGSYDVGVLDHDVGPANVLFARVDGRPVLIGANREINEVAYYTIDETEEPHAEI